MAVVRGAGEEQTGPMDRHLLTPDEVNRASADLGESWTVTSQAITRTVEFPSFLAAVGFISDLAPIAERLDHHPDLTLSWRTVGITLSTHSEGGVTGLDMELAGQLDRLIRRAAAGG
jgi:4a-hydroxytetrahydrobiopterin dehydratase